MSVITDLANELDRYPADETSIAIIDVARNGSSTDTDINENEVWKFKVRVTNNGHINMTDVTLHILGLNGTLVSESATTGFANDMTVASLNPQGGGGIATSRYFYFKAPPNDMPAGTQLVDAHIDEWNGDNFAHLFSNHTKNHTDAPVGFPRAFYSAEVFPA